MNALVAQLHLQLNSFELITLGRRTIPHLGPNDLIKTIPNNQEKPVKLSTKQHPDLGSFLIHPNLSETIKEVFRNTTIARYQQFDHKVA